MSGVVLDGAAVVVTGASSGIGRATARRFARNGSNLVLVARSGESLVAAADECRTKGARVVEVSGDVAEPETVDRIAARAVDELGGIDVWVNDAAVMSYGEMTETPVKAQRRIVEVNLLGTMWGTRAALAVMQRQSRGVVVNVASLYGKVSTPFVSGYSASKFGILGFSHAVRQELQRYPGVDLSVVLPGSIDTPIFRHAANYTGRRVKPVPPAASPDRVARAVVACARKPRRQVTVGQLQHLVAWGRAVMPGAYSTVAPRVMRFVAIGKEPEDPHDGNLYVAEPELDQVRGGWRNRLVRSTVAAAAIAPVAVAGARAARSRAGGG